MLCNAIVIIVKIMNVCVCVCPSSVLKKKAQKKTRKILKKKNR